MTTAVEAVIIDSGGANLASLQFALERLGARTQVSSDPELIAQAPRVILPGVGAAADAMQRLHAAGLASLLPALKQPVLGICLGMQLLYEASEEGPATCLGVVPGTVRRMKPRPGRPVPHMGWNQLRPVSPDPLLAGIEPDAYAYFVHSFCASVSPATVATAEYGEPLTALVRQGNFWGTQFHPERSAATGARLLNNFLRIEG